MAEAFQEKYEPEGSTYRANKINILEDDLISPRIISTDLEPNYSNEQWHLWWHQKTSLSNSSIVDHAEWDHQMKQSSIQIMASNDQDLENDVPRRDNMNTNSTFQKKIK